MPRDSESDACTVRVAERYDNLVAKVNAAISFGLGMASQLPEGLLKDIAEWEGRISKAGFDETEMKAQAYESLSQKYF